MADEAACFWIAIREIFSNGVQDTKRERGCTLHWKMNITKCCNKIPKESQKEFQLRVHQWKSSPTQEKEEKSYRELWEWISGWPERSGRKTCLNFIKWWEGHKHHIFDAYRPDSIHDTNLSEAVHSKDKRVLKHASLAEGFKTKLAQHLQHQQELQYLAATGWTKRTGPKLEQLQERFEKQQERLDRIYQEEISNSPLSTHRFDQRVNKKDIVFRVNYEKQRDPKIDDQRPQIKHSKRRVGSNSSKMRFNKAKKEAYEVVLIRKKLETNDYLIKLEKSTSIDQEQQETPPLYDIILGEVPSCNCSFFEKNQERRKIELCKHIFWCYKFLLKLTEKHLEVFQIKLKREELNNLQLNKLEKHQLYFS